MLIQIRRVNVGIKRNLSLLYSESWVRLLSQGWRIWLLPTWFNSVIINPLINIFNIYIYIYIYIYIFFFFFKIKQAWRGPVHKAAIIGDYPEVAMLLEMGEDMDQRDKVKYFCSILTFVYRHSQHFFWIFFFSLCSTIAATKWKTAAIKTFLLLKAGLLLFWFLVEKSLAHDKFNEIHRLLRFWKFFRTSFYT